MRRMTIDEHTIAEAVEAERWRLIHDSRYYLDWRGVETPCAQCHGTGKRVYDSTSTWRGGVGGCAMTAAECDRCWGSGDEHNPWEDKRKRDLEMKARVDRLAAERLSTQLGVHWPDLHPSVEAIAEELDRLSRGRKQRPYWFAETCTSMARVLRALVSASKEAKEPKAEGQ